MAIERGNNRFGVQKQSRIEIGEFVKIANKILLGIMKKFRDVEPEGKKLTLASDDNRLHLGIIGKCIETICHFLDHVFIESIHFPPG
jgi:hypothetical protein